MKQTIDLFSKLYRQNFDKLQQRLATQYPALSSDDCADIVQQAWTELYSRIVKRPDNVPDKMLGYVWQTAYNMALARHNDNTHYDHETFQVVQATADSNTDSPTELEALLGGKDESDMLCLERLALLDLALQQLTPAHRELIEGFYFRHESMRDLSEKLAFKSEAVAKVIKGRVIKHLREKMYQLSRSTSLRIAA